MATLALANPPRNMLSFAVLEELDACLDAIAGDDAISVVVLGSAVPGYFAAHADLDDIAALGHGPIPQARIWPRVMRRIEEMPQPVVASIDGQAWGGGLELALACTLRVCSPRAHFSFPETSIGLIPGAGGTQRLPRLIGAGRAAEMILAGRVVRAEEALTRGLVEAVLDGEPYGDVAAAWIRALAARPRGALVAAKRAIVEGRRLPLRDGLRLEAELFVNRLSDPRTTPLVDAVRARYGAAAPHEHVSFELPPT